MKAKLLCLTMASMVLVFSNLSAQPRKSKLTLEQMRNISTNQAAEVLHAIDPSSDFLGHSSGPEDIQACVLAAGDALGLLFIDDQSGVFLMIEGSLSGPDFIPSGFGQAGQVLIVTDEIWAFLTLRGIFNASGGLDLIPQGDGAILMYPIGGTGGKRAGRGWIDPTTLPGLQFFRHSCSVDLLPTE